MTSRHATMVAPAAYRATPFWGRAMFTKRILAALVLCWFTAHVTAADTPEAGKQVPVTTTVKIKSADSDRGATLRYLLYLPADYDSNAAAKWPLVLFLHGSGERGDDIEKVKIHGPPKLVSQGKEFPFMVVSPQCPTGSRWNADELASLVDELAGQYRVDRQRLYVTGLSMGGSGTWSLVSAYPDKFAAAMPLCGRGDLEAVAKLAKTPIWVLVGAKDRSATVQNCQDMANALAKAGCEGRFTLYFHLPHDCWTVTYNNPEVYEWLLSHKLAVAK
jgi:predicted peptidase